ncbi:MAG: VWA domain-containing protein, partial [Desulfobacterales bacterium]|nr:VWA domain-containing protein [Desulfobacterales bacterium]
DTQVTTLIPAQDLRENRNIVGAIATIRAGGNTALFGGVSQGASELRKAEDGDYVHRLVLLSDGLANVGPRSPGELGRLGAALFKEKISVTTVGVGTDYNEDLMARLSQNSDGNTYFVESGLDLPRIFASELGKVLNVVAKNVDLEIELPRDVTPLEIIGREGRIKGQRLELSMNQLYGGQEKYALIKVRVQPTAAGSTRELARARVNYHDPYGRKTQTAMGRTETRFTDNARAVAASVNVDVVKNYHLNLNALAQEKAIVLSDQGKTEQAAATLKQSAASLKKIGELYQDPALKKEAHEVETQARDLATQGMSKKNRKVLRTKSYQMKNQQQIQ